MTTYLEVIETFETKLPKLIGEQGWTAHGEQITEILQQLKQETDEDEQEALLYSFVSLLEQYSSALRAWRYETNLPLWRDIHDESTLRQEMSALLPAEIAQNLSSQDYTSAAVVLKPGDSTRRAKITPGGTGKSIKFSNFKIDIGELYEIAGGAFMAGYDAVKDPHPLVVAAGVLLTIRALVKAITVEINEQDTSVFWGFIQALDRNAKGDKVASEEIILAKTNSERERFGLQPLTESQFKGSLERLKQMKSIEMINNGRWYIVENFQVSHT